MNDSVSFCSYRVLVYIARRSHKCLLYGYFCAGCDNTFCRLRLASGYSGIVSCNIQTWNSFISYAYQRIYTSTISLAHLSRSINWIDYLIRALFSGNLVIAVLIMHWKNFDKQKFVAKGQLSGHGSDSNEALERTLDNLVLVIRRRNVTFWITVSCWSERGNLICATIFLCVFCLPHAYLLVNTIWTLEMGQERWNF